MGSSQSNIKCPKCEYEYATIDVETRSFEQYVFCEKCGYSYQRTIVIDRGKSNKIWAEFNSLKKLGKYKEAYKILGYKEDYVNNLNEKELKSLVETKRKPEMYKIKDGKWVYKEKETGGLGSWKISFNGGGSVGHFIDEKSIKEFEEDFIKEGGFKMNNGNKANEVYYTFKKDDEWFVKDLIINKELSFEEYFKRKDILQNLQ